MNAERIEVRLRPEEVAALDEHRGDETRPEAARKIIRKRLMGD